MDYNKFKETLGSSGPYLKSKDFEAGREVGVVPWLFKGEVVPALLHYEGWVWDEENGGQKKNKKKPVRFTFEEYTEGIDFTDYDWSVSNFQGKTSKDHPKGCIAFILKDIESGEIKLASFSQVTLCNSLMKFLNPNEKFYVKNIDKKILVIGKENERTWTSAIKDDDDGVLDTFEDALNEFTFSWDDYIAGEKEIFDNGDCYQDVLAASGGAKKTAKKAPAKKAANKNVSKKQEEESLEEDDGLADSWGQVKTPKGRNLRDLSFEELMDLGVLLEEKEKTDTTLYKAVTWGVKEHKQKSTPIEELDDVDF